MDSLTQLTLGAAVGYAVAGKNMGKKSLLWGAFAGTLPDLDFFLTAPFKDNFLYLKIHRGFSHSLLFAVTGPLLISYLAKKTWPNLKQKVLYWLFFWGILTHSLLDCFTSWGTQLLWPLPQRIAFNSIFIIDPLYTVPLIITCLATLLISSHNKRNKWIATGLLLSSLYLLVAVGIKQIINHKFESYFNSHNLTVTQYTTRPSAFNIILWSANAETESGYYYSMISLFDKEAAGKPYFSPKNHELTAPYTDPKSQELISYTKGFYSVEEAQDGILIHDLRYGYMGDPWIHGENYVFSYQLTKNDEETVQLTIQNPRPKNRNTLLKQLWIRLKGLPLSNS